MHRSARLTVQCEKARTIARRGVASTMGPLPGHGSNVAAVFGMAPPRAIKVVIYADGAERSLPVRDGVFGIAVRTPRSVRFVLPDGVTPSLPLKVGPGAA